MELFTTKVKHRLNIRIFIGILLILLGVIVCAYTLIIPSLQKPTMMIGNEIIHRISSNKIDPGYEGKFVCVSGIPEIKGIKDKLLTYKIDALKLKRTSKMYQWTEKGKQYKSHSRRNFHAYKKFSYQKTWSEDRIKSEAFSYSYGHVNPEKKLSTKTIVNENVFVGDYRISPKIISSLELNKKLNISKLKLKSKKEILYIDGVVHVSENLYKPEIGDYLIEYNYIDAEYLSVIGLLKDGSVIPMKFGKSEVFKISTVKEFSANTAVNSGISEYLIYVAIILITFGSLILLNIQKYLLLLKFKNKKSSDLTTAH